MIEKKRNQYFIDKDYQRKFIIKFSLIILMSSFLFTAIIFYFIRDASLVTITNTQVSVKKSFDFLFPIALGAFILVMVISCLMVLLLTLLTTHKISGPLSRFAKEADLLAEGNFKGNFNIRGDDQLKRLSSSLESMRQEMRKNHIEVQKAFGALRSFIVCKNFSFNAKDSQECVRRIKEVQALLDKFET